MGGRGKTPAALHLATLLREMGERPSILSRGYGRSAQVDGVVVVSDGDRVRGDVARSGDEPLMLARAAPGVAVLSCPDRYLAGRLAELHLGCTVHILDDGFQHLALERDVDLLMMEPEDARDARTLPTGRLRESLSTARLADALLVAGADADESRDLGTKLGIERVFRVVRGLEPARRLDVFRPSAPVAPGSPAFAVAGIARPERFFADLAGAGWTVAGTRAFRDHHRYTRRDVTAIVDAARAAQATIVLTTEKDLMRLLPFRPLPLPLAWVPLRVTIEPPAEFRAWLAGRLAAARPADPAGVAGATTAAPAPAAPPAPAAQGAT